MQNNSSSHSLIFVCTSEAQVELEGDETEAGGDQGVLQQCGPGPELQQGGSCPHHQSLVTRQAEHQRQHASNPAVVEIGLGLRFTTASYPVLCWELRLVHIHTRAASVIKLSREMLASKLFWMYFQSNSTPRAPTQRKTSRVSTSSANPQPSPATNTCGEILDLCVY